MSILPYPLKGTSKSYFRGSLNINPESIINIMEQAEEHVPFAVRKKLIFSAK